MVSNRLMETDEKSKTQNTILYYYYLRRIAHWHKCVLRVEVSRAWLYRTGCTDLQLVGSSVADGQTLTWPTEYYILVIWQNLVLFYLKYLVLLEKVMKESMYFKVSKYTHRYVSLNDQASILRQRRRFGNVINEKTSLCQNHLVVEV